MTHCVSHPPARPSARPAPCPAVTLVPAVGSARPLAVRCFPPARPPARPPGRPSACPSVLRPSVRPPVRPSVCRLPSLAFFCCYALSRTHFALAADVGPTGPCILCVSPVSPNSGRKFTYTLAVKGCGKGRAPLGVTGMTPLWRLTGVFFSELCFCVFLSASNLCALICFTRCGALNRYRRCCVDKKCLY